MMRDNYQGPERRKFLRLDYITPLACKVCKPETISKILQGYTTNISQSGLLCHLNATVNPEDIIWVSFDRATLSICQELEENCFIYQGGIIGKVVRIENRENGTYTVRLQFIIREEQNLSLYLSEDLFFKRSS
jgi:hypothetical protein